MPIKDTKRFNHFLIFGFMLSLALVWHFIEHNPVVKKRAPYLQMLYQHGVTIVWRTPEKTKSHVNYGLNPQALNMHQSNPIKTNFHFIKLKNLTSDTQYYYCIAPCQSDQIYQFKTAPKRDTNKPIKLWVIGDPGLYNEPAQKNKANILNRLESTKKPNASRLDLLITTGDNAYPNGTSQELQEAIFEGYKNLLTEVMIVAAYGNHDARSEAYAKSFVAPKKAELGGLRSGNSYYYSMDYGPLHLVVLDTQGHHLWRYHSMLEWLKDDLQQNKLPWTLVLGHASPYSKIGHNSDSRFDSVMRMFDFREKFNPIIEAYQVDMVITGHSHIYARSEQIKNHYGTSDTFNSTTMIQARGPEFNKAKQPEGTIYTVVGNTSKSDCVNPKDQPNHPATPVLVCNHGSLLIEITQERLEAMFIDINDNIRDQIQIIKPKNP
jgi:predicted phosphodiesterase